MSEQGTIHWPAAEWKRAKSLLDRGFSIPMVSQMMGIKQQKLRGKLRWEEMTPAEREARAMRIKENRKDRNVRAQALSERRYQPERLGYEKAPEHLFEERARRLATPRTIGQQIFGDPPPGYSALDRKRQGLSV